MDSYAHGLRDEHEIFHQPHPVELTIEDQPASSSYLTRASGRELGTTMPMWRVQTEGYRDGKGMLVGVVSHGSILEASPDSEYISSGLNTKGCDAVALGRQGNFFHWGFAASPTYMTDEAKLVFVNAIHYISQFQGQRAFVKKRISLTRSSVDNMLYQISEEGFASFQAMMAEWQKEEEEQKEELRQRQADGEELSEFEIMMLNSPPFEGYQREDLLYGVPEQVKQELGDDWEGYIAYYTENRPYLYATPGWGAEIQVDEDAQKLGIANHDLRLLDQCVELLENQQDQELAQRLLTRYTEENFDTAAEWKQWLNTHRDYLFFSEAGGFKFLVDINLEGAPQVTNAPAKTGLSNDDFQSHLKTLTVEEPQEGEPVKFSCCLVPVETKAGPRLRLAVKVNILDGWHIYSNVPPGKPYITTTLETVCSESLEAIGDWEKSTATRYAGEPDVLVWEEECLFTRDFQYLDQSDGTPQIKLTISYQACDENMCLRPTEETFELQPE